MTDHDKLPNIEMSTAQAMTLLGVMDRSWHDNEHDQMKDLLVQGAAEIEALTKERDDLLEELSSCKEHPGGCGYWREAAKQREVERGELATEVDLLKGNMEARLSDHINGTPCAEIRWQQEREELIAERDLALAMSAAAAIDMRDQVLRTIADLPTPRNEMIVEGHEQAYRAVEALTPAPDEQKALDDMLAKAVNETWLEAISVVSKRRNSLRPGQMFGILNETIGDLEDARRACLPLPHRRPGCQCELI